MNDPFLNDFTKRLKALNDELVRDCKNCDHYKEYERSDGTIGHSCEKWKCEFTAKQAKISHISKKDETWDEDMDRDAAEYMADQEE